jgi:hypothetical protein
MYLNIETNEYPRFPGDLELLGWEQGTPLPENWVEVERVDFPEHLETETFYENAPIKVGDTWKQSWSVRTLSDEELLQIAKNLVLFKSEAHLPLTEEEALLLAEIAP